MARPYNRWDPSQNVDLIVAAADGPLEVDGDDERWARLVSEWILPILYEGILPIGYSRELSTENGVAPANGALVRGLQYMPEGLTFFGTDPVNGEPLPEDAADPWFGNIFRYINLGYRMGLRGWIASFGLDSLNVEMEVRWGDGTIRNNADTRGAWTGAVMALYDAPAFQTDHLAYVLHGKRLGDASWEYRGGHVDDPVGAFVPASAIVTPWDGVDEGRVRIVVTGGPPAWTVTTQYWDPGIPDWVDITSSVVDLQSHGIPGFEALMLMTGQLFHGVTKVAPGVLPIPTPEQETYFNRVSVTQFEPWILDVAGQNRREFMFRLNEMLGGILYENYPVTAKVPATDVVHFPFGSAGQPEELRDFDDLAGWGIVLNQETVLSMFGIEDRRLMIMTPGPATALPVCLSDTDAFGTSIPFGYVGRYRFFDLAGTPDERCVASWGPAGYAAAPGAGASGLGLTWRPTNDGEIVLKYWDGVAGAWLELTAPLRIDEYDDTVVDIGFVWTGEHGDVVGRPDYQLRLVIDGVTMAEVLETTLDIEGTILACIGTANPGLRMGFAGKWYGGATYYEPVTDTELLHAFDEPQLSGFSNPSFEDAALSARPGEAQDWAWQVFQQVGAWADFSAYRNDLSQFRYGREGFGAGWLRDYSWAYADEAARLAATGFTADDVGGAAWQIDLNRNFILTDHAPITWVESDVGENQDWTSVLASIAAAVFNEGIPSFEATAEHFAIWDGAPWFDTYSLIAPCNDTLGPFGGPTGFDGWFDYLFATNLDPLCVESFEEAWGNDPMSTVGGQRWQPDTAPGGILRGAAIQFPLTIPPNRNRLIILTDAAVPAVVTLPSPTYPDAPTLAADLNAILGALLPGLGLAWDVWVNGDDTGLSLGWDGITVMSLWWGFATVEDSLFFDARELLGLMSFSPNGHASGVRIPGWFYPSLPAGITVDDHLLLDSWSANSALVVPDLILGDVVLENDMVGATFDATLVATYLERFLLTGWVDPAAVWVTDLSLVATTPATFISGTTREDFLDTEWPDQMFP